MGQLLLSLLHATRGRPQLSIEARQRWFDAAKDPSRVEHVFAIDDGDEESRIATEGLNRTIVKNPNGSGKAFNEAAAAATGKVVILMADDVYPPKDWDEVILNRIGAEIDKPLVLAVWDGIRADALIGWPICTKAYLQLYPEFLGPYHGLFGDSEFSWRAHKSGFVREARDVVFFHDHPYLTGKPMDETYSRQNIPMEYLRSCALFLRRNADIPIVECDSILWACYQTPEGEYRAIMDMPAEMVQRVRKEFPHVSYIREQLKRELDKRLSAIVDPKILQRLRDECARKDREAGIVRNP